MALNPIRLPQIQDYLRQHGLQGWLLYDFRGLNPIARRVAEIPADMLLTRRWAYWLPAEGEPAWLAHRIEAGAFRRTSRTSGSIQLLAIAARGPTDTDGWPRADCL